MKKLLLCFLAAVLAPVTFAQGFEGKVTFKMINPRSKPQEMRYAIKGDKVRIELPDQKEMGGMIMDTSKREMMMLMDAQRMYMVMPMPDVSDARAQKSGPEPTLEKTGETEKILGYTAEKYISTYQDTKTELWLTEGLGSFAPMQNPMGGRGGRAGAQEWERLLAGKALFPLRVVSQDKAGKESFRMEATDIQKQALPDGMFSPPEDYQKMDMGGMMQGMMPGKRKR